MMLAGPLLPSTWRSIRLGVSLRYQQSSKAQVRANNLPFRTATAFRHPLEVTLFIGRCLTGTRRRTKTDAGIGSLGLPIFFRVSKKAFDQTV